ncbi:MAG: hypothetical protein ACLRP8_08005 [Roseburia intestinalis]
MEEKSVETASDGSTKQKTVLTVWKKAEGTMTKEAAVQTEETIDSMKKQKS